MLILNEMGTKFCQNQEYNSTITICCDGILHRYEKRRECCGNQTYDSETEDCKTNTVYQKQTCDSKVFNPRKNICCEGQIFTKNKNRQCCGREIFDPRVQICEDGIKKHKFYRFCGSIRFDMRTHSCCGGNVYRLDSQSICCDANMINNDTEMCCDGMFHLRLSGFRCCGQQIYNELDSFCDGKSVAHLDPIPEMYSSCCGDVTIDTRTQVCCLSLQEMSEYPLNKFNEDHDRCCLGVPYSSMTTICTTKGLQPIIGVCGIYTYDIGVDLCCDGTTYIGAKERGLVCCLANSSFGTDQLCCPRSETKPNSYIR